MTTDGPDDVFPADRHDIGVTTWACLKVLIRQHAD